jgi:RHS repeat-associated protein
MLNNTSKTGRALLAVLALGLTGNVGFAADAHYYVNDPLATTVAISDAAGEIAAIEADAFGAPLAAGEAPSRYTGKPYDADLGAYVFPFRNYRPEEGRWMSADPSGFPDGVNGHAYNALPLHQIDPLGLAVTFGSYTNSSGNTSTVSSQQQQRFHDTMQQIRNQGPEGRMVYDKVYDPNTNVSVINTPGEIASGSGGLVNGTLTGQIGLDFNQSAFVDPALGGAYANQLGSAMAVLAHELGHAIYQFSDPGNVVWENYFRPSDNQRTHYRDIEVTADIINEMRNKINNLVNPHTE